VEGTALRRDAGFGSRGYASGLGGGTAALLALNWILAAATWAAFALFLVALVTL
jgi:hypothetical protein